MGPCPTAAQKQLHTSKNSSASSAAPYPLVNFTTTVLDNHVFSLSITTLLELPKICQQTRLTELLFPAPLDPGLHVGSKRQSTISSCQQDTAEGPIR